jgi:GNAT superfamily N-acetyltransferase
MFASIGMDQIAGDPPPGRRLLRAVINRDLLWVAVDGEDPRSSEVVGYGFGSHLDDHLHLEQVSVRPEFARRGIGAQIFQSLESAAVNSGMSISTLFTFADVPWNAPYYQRLGYRELPASAFGPQLATVLRQEQVADGDGPQRIAMYKELAVAQAAPGR